MKELSIEEKAYDGNYKAYTELINRLEDVKNAIKKQNYGIAMDILCKPYPEYQITTSTELKESDGLRIIKAIKYGLDHVFTNNTTVFEVTKEQCLAWLEKQGEHANFRNKIQIGDKVTRNEDGVLVNLSQLNRVAKKQGEQKPYGQREECSYCQFNYAGECKGSCAMKRSEQKPVEWSIFDYRTWQYIVSDVLTEMDGIGQYLDNGECKKISKYMQEEWSKRLSVEQRTTELPKGEDYGIDGLYAAIDILQKTLGKVDGYQSDDGILEHKCAISAVKKLYEQKPAWSKEDEKFVHGLIRGLAAKRDIHGHTTFSSDCIDITGTINWLKSLKDRYTWKPSKGQLECLDYAIEKAEKDWSPLTNNRIYLTLKALKEQLLELRGSKV